MQPRSVVVCYAKPETGPKALFVDALVQLLIADRDREGGPLIADVVSITSSPRIAATRNMLVDTFLRHPAEPSYLLMLDDDMAFRPDIIEHLLAAADPTSRPIVSGLYFGGKIHGRQVPHAYVLNATGDAFNPVEGLEGGWGPVIRIHAAGAGCLLMHRDALVKIGEAFHHTGHAWFVEGAANGRDYGEDMAFCLRAVSLDIPIHCHTGVVLGHVKPGIIDEISYAEYLARRDVWGDDEIARQHAERLRLPTALAPAEKVALSGEELRRRAAKEREPSPFRATHPREPFILPPSEIDAVST